LFLVHYLSVGQLTRRKPQPNIIRAGAVSTRFFFTLQCFQKKKKENEARPGLCSAWQKDYGIMPCSCLARHPSGLIPFPFGLPAYRPVNLLSFSFFRFSVFFWKIFFGCVPLQLSLNGLPQGNWKVLEKS